MKATGIHVCVTASADHLAGRRRAYKAVKAAVLEAGRFSVFEATADIKSAHLFTKLHKDPEIEIFELPFPWLGVRRRVQP